MLEFILKVCAGALDARQLATDPEFFVWISASAGTGKTKLLIDRILRLLLVGEDKILCLTFTKAAVNEVLERIHGTVLRWMYSSREELFSELSKLYHDDEISDELINRARSLFGNLICISLRIETIHSFCISILREFAIHLGVEQEFIVRDCADLFHDALGDMLSEISTAKYFDSSASTEVLSAGLEDIMSVLLSRYGAHDNAKLSHLAELVDLYIKQADEINLDLKIVWDSQDILQLSNLLSLSKGKRDNVCGEILSDWVSSVFAADHLPMRKLMLNEDLTAKNNVVTKRFLDKHCEYADVINVIQSALSDYWVSVNTKRILTNSANVIGLFLHFSSFYNARKKAKNFFDYDQVVDLAIELLKEERVLFYVDQNFRHLLVDESQDNSIEQWRIIEYLCSEMLSGSGRVVSKYARTVFIVGDIKQSIYSFQGADISCWMKSFKHFKELGKYNKAIKLLTLNESFRSSVEVINFVNLLFRGKLADLSEQLGADGLKVDDYPFVQHVTTRSNDRGYVEVMKCLPNLDDYGDNEGDRYNSAAADFIARRIQFWLDCNKILESTNMPIKAEDIMVLVRKRSNFDEYLGINLEKFGIRINVCSNFVLNSDRVVKDLMYLGEFVLLPIYDMALIAVLKSPLFYTEKSKPMMYEDDILRVSCGRDHGVTVLDKVREYYPEVFARLEKLRKLSSLLPPSGFYAFVIREYSHFYGRVFGKQCVGIMHAFLERAIDFELSNSPSLQKFIWYVKRHQQVVQLGAKRDSGSVKLTTIHGAKGMQSPIVILPDTSSVPTERSKVVFSESGMPFCYSSSIFYSPEFEKLKLKCKLEGYNEYMRLLYVAITRAQDELYVLHKGGHVQAGSWFDIITKKVASWETRAVPWNKKLDSVEIMSSNFSYQHFGS